MLLRLLPAAGQWVFSGSAPEWARPIEPFYDLVVFLRLDPALRMDRLRRREAAQHGKRDAQRHKERQAERKVGSRPGHTATKGRPRAAAT